MHSRKRNYQSLRLATTHMYTHWRMDKMSLLAWTLLTVSLWTAGSSQTLHGEIVTVYSKLLSTETIECSCVDFSCDSVYWFHMAPEKYNVKFVGKCNNADRVTFGNVEKARFKISKRGSMSFMLRIINVTLEDTGIYSCVLKNKSNSDMWRPGVLLLPGVTPPTLPPKPKPKAPPKPVCTCKKNHSPDGCGKLVLWPLVGCVAVLALAVICTLYYFSHELND